MSLSILKVDTNLYSGDLKVIFSDNPLDEKVTLRYSSDFGGHAEDYTFEWYYQPPPVGTKPTNGAPAEAPWLLHEQGNGKNTITIEGANVRTLSDNFYICRYRALQSTNPAGTNQWSHWTNPKDVEGWIKRVLNAINPFEQRITDLANNHVNAIISMISEAGARWEGNVALNSQSLDNYGLIEIYETILNRGSGLSINAAPPINYGPANDALLLVAGRISDLYMLLGNEAYADAIDPTIAIASDNELYGAEAGSLFCFMNQATDLLDEELLLLRGRDGAIEPDVDVNPVYNRLYWNFTKGIEAGEVAYALNYGIRDELGNVDGVINEDDAARFYPQGHGDAWGHYLMATKVYYALLANPAFTWNPRSETIQIGGQDVGVDYQDERKFAAAAAARARAGLEIVSRTYRQNYTENDRDYWNSLVDEDTNRAWGVSDWAGRVGQGILFDWMTGNSCLPYEDLNPDHTGIEKVDRGAVPELTQLASLAGNVQSAMDRADANLNPLGLSRDVVPFDINPALLGEADAKTHFEQIYDRAVVALRNAQAVFDAAAGCSQNLRAIGEDAAEFAADLDASEGDYQNRLIEIFGYPYADDIGMSHSGATYPEGYDGPDIVHYQYVDLGESEASMPTASVTIVREVYGMAYVTNNWKLNPNWWWFPSIFGVGSLSNTTPTEIEYHVGWDGFYRKPVEWTGRRQAEGEIQKAYRDFILAFYDLEEAVEAYKDGVEEIKDNYERLQLTAAAGFHELKLTQDYNNWVKVLTFIKNAAESAEGWLEIAHDIAQAEFDSAEKIIPLAMDDPFFIERFEFSEFRVAEIAGHRLLRRVLLLTQHISETAIDFAELDLEWNLAENSVKLELEQQRLEVQQAARKLASLEAAIQRQVVVMQQNEQEYRRLLAEGLRLLDDRTAFRRSAAAHVQSERYRDMAFRVFRNDALQQYTAAFDLAARYVYLAAKAYDYETGFSLHDMENVTGSEFLSDIVKARGLGRIHNGQPMLGPTTGEPGLADILARMKANWDVLDGRLGFNNPDAETSRFSLRTELFRRGAETNRDYLWRDDLWKFKVDDLRQDPDFQQYCLPFYAVDEGPEPGLKIPFSTCIYLGKNFFNWDLAGGDGAYDSSHFATKIRSVGVWFSNYNGTALANTPRVYLIPVGYDVMRSPTDNSGAIRSWKIVDQALPVPFDIGDGFAGDSSWIPMIDSLTETMGAIRRYPSFRAYHDAGYVPSEMTLTSRLVGRSVWNTRWILIIPAGVLHSDRNQALETLIEGPNGNGQGIKDIKIFFQTYSNAGN